MTEWRMIDLDVLRGLVGAVKDTSWSWQTGEVKALCGRMGWKLFEEDTNDVGGYADAGWNLKGDDIILAFRDGRVDDITMRMTETAREESRERDRFIDDAFAEVVEVVSSVLGVPTGRGVSDSPTVRWRLAESTVEVGQFEVAVKLTWAGNVWQDEWDAIAEALD